MKFALTEEQHAFGSAIDQLLQASATTEAVREWSAGSADTGLKIWQRLAEMGVHGLGISDANGGLDAEVSDMMLAFERLGFHAAPGPYIETVALIPRLIDDSGLLENIADGSLVISAAMPLLSPRGLDADIAHQAFLIGDRSISPAHAGAMYRSIDPSRRLFDLTEANSPSRLDSERVAAAADLAALACSAELLGAGERLISDTVEYAKTRHQFGRAIGEYQALKHQLADVRVALDFARPLVNGASVGFYAENRQRSVSAAKVAANRASYQASRVALQVHGAIGYTDEFDVSLWIRRVRALVGAWGTSAFHRDRIAAGLAVS